MATEGQLPSDPDDGVKPLLRMSHVLAELKEKLGGFAALENEMKEMFGDQPSERPGAPRFVERRKLRKIVDNDPKLSLSLGELRGLDALLEGVGHGLAYNPLFDRPELLRSLAKSGRIGFLLGSREDKSDELRVNISHWDLLALNCIQSRVLSLSENLRIDIHEMPMNTKREHAREALRNEELCALFSDQGPSLVCLASSLGNQMAEWMLCKMAGDTRIEEFCARRSDDARRLAFEFVWPEDRKFVLPSAFHIYGKDVEEESPEACAAVENNGACFRYSGGCLIDDLAQKKEEGYSYALCCAQRRTGNRTWLLVAGLTAPGTYAAADWATRMATQLSPPESDHGSEVFWNLIRVKGVKVQEARRLTYRLGDPEIVDRGEGLFLDG